MDSVSPLSLDERETDVLFSEEGLEALYALNMGDFLSDTVFSSDMAGRLQHRAQNEPSRIEKQIEELVELYSMDKALGVMGGNWTELYASIATTLKQMLQAQQCSLFKRADEESPLSLQGSSEQTLKGQTLVWPLKAMGSKPTVLSEEAVHSLATVHLVESPSHAAIAPFYQDGDFHGVVLVSSDIPFTAEAMTFMGEIAALMEAAESLQGFVAKAKQLMQNGVAPVNELLGLRADMTEAIANLSIQQQQFLVSLSTLVDARNEFSQGHSQATADCAQQIGEALLLNEKQIELLYYAGLLGGVGKFQADFSSRKSLSSDEVKQLNQHPNWGVELLTQIHVLGDIAPYIQYQNERWDGSGQPEGLKGQDIPLGSRIVAVANAYTAMRQPRPYRGEALSQADALQALEEESGTQWDPLIVKTLKQLQSC